MTIYCTLSVHVLTTVLLLALILVVLELTHNFYNSNLIHLKVECKTSVSAENIFKII